jgi:1-acyl-sn-glycerol-3-phosphate acyltransferase
MRAVLRHPARVGGRLLGFIARASAAWRDHARRLRPAGRGSDPRSCAEWLHYWSPRTLERIGVQTEARGVPPTRGMLVCNHLSYLDITVIAAAVPAVFVSKAEVRYWPFLGSLARCGGTLFLKREARSHVAEIGAQLRPIVEGGTIVAIFPEGTSSGGDTVLPFRSSLLEPAAANDWPVTPAWIEYEVSEGTVAEDVAYWRDMTFAPHFLNLLARRRILGRVHFGPSVTGIRDRKLLARRLHDEVCALADRARNGGAPSLDQSPPLRASA